MKNIKINYSIFISFLLLVNSTSITFAQKTPGDDFKIIDIYGNEHQLYNDYLNQGKYVFVDFFSRTCGTCQYIAPMIDTVYRNFGCNCGDIIFLGIASGNNDSVIFNFAQTYGMSFPTASGLEGGGNIVFQQYGYNYTPYKILIDPQHKIIVDNLYFNSTKVLRDSLLNLNVNLNIMPCCGNDFLHFALLSQTDSIIGTIDKTTQTIDVRMPSGTDLTQLNAKFIVSSNSVSYINSTEQVSGETINDFSSGSVLYEIISESGVSKYYTVNVQTGSAVKTPVNSFFISPNPSNGSFKIEGSSKYSNLYAKLSDFSGKELLAFNIESPNIHLPNMKKGIYLLTISNNQIIQTIKLVIN
jgi:thiol-disulfide isomerase/thioredoxin